MSEDKKGAEPKELPRLDFSTFVLSIVGSAHVHLGEAPDPYGGGERNLDLAKQDVELLTLLQDKTRGNLTGDEERLLDQALYDLHQRIEELADEAKGS